MFSPRMMSRAALVAVWLFGLCAIAHAQSKPSADLIITNAKIWTVDKARPNAEALAVLGERIVAVGSAAEVDAWHGPQTKVLDAQGKLLLPGFNDAHVHFVDGGDHLQDVQLKDAATPEEFARRIGERAKTTPKGEWVMGGDWDEQKWSPANLPTKELIDPVTPDTPVWVNRYDGHESLANSVTLQACRHHCQNCLILPGGEIVRDAQGNPTGVLKDAAQDLVMKVMPPMTPAHRLRAIHQAMDHAASVGVTSVQDMNPSYDDVRAYCRAAGTRRVSLYASTPRLWKRAGKTRPRSVSGARSVRHCCGWAR